MDGEVRVGDQAGDFGVINKLSDIEEKQKILKERATAFGESFVKNKDETGQELMRIKNDLKSIKFEIEKIKGVVDHLLEDSGNFARKEELNSLQRVFKIFEPLKFLGEEDVKRIVKEELNKNKEAKDIKTVNYSY